MANSANKQDRIPPLEWAVAAIGAIIALSILGAIGWQAIWGHDDPVPLLEVRAESVTPAGRSHVVTIEVTNASGRTAAAVQVEGVLGKDQPDEQTSSATIDYVPGNGKASGALMFSADPRGRALDLRVTGYEHP